MEIIQKKARNVSGGKCFRVFTLLFLFLLATIQFSVAQESDTVVAESTPAVADEPSGPSLDNISKNLANSASELEKIRHEEIMSYVYMGLGFSVVIAIAWFTTVLARKRKRKEDEVRAMRAQNKHHHHHHHPRR